MSDTTILAIITFVSIFAAYQIGRFLGKRAGVNSAVNYFIDNKLVSEEKLEQLAKDLQNEED